MFSNPLVQNMIQQVVQQQMEEFMNNGGPEEMINQVFNVIKGKKLRSMLPPFLAEMDVDEVKALCLEQVIKYNYNVLFKNVI